MQYPLEGEPMEPANDVLRRLREEVFAPCCFKQTLDVHVSPLADELRAELRARLDAGESAERIKQDLARRYGPGVLVRPMSRAAGLALLFGAAALAAVPLLVLWRRRAGVAPEPAPTPSPPEDPALSDLLDDELAAEP